MTKRHDFDDNIARTIADENRLLAWLWSRPGTVSVDDVRKEHRYRELDIDFVLRRSEDPSHLGLSVEAKVCDKISKTGNLFLETVQDVDTDDPGCFLDSAADYWLYLDQVNRVVFQFDLNQVRTWVLARRDEFPERTAYWRRRIGDHVKNGTARGLCVPWPRLASAGLVWIYRDFEDEIIWSVVPEELVDQSASA